MKLTHPVPHRVEIQAVKSSDTVVIHVSDGRKLIVDVESNGEISLSCTKWNTSRPLRVYDYDGNELAEILVPNPYAEKEDSHG